MSTHRRDFMKAAAVVAGSLSELIAQTAPDWKKQIGLELFTVRDELTKDYEGTIAKVAEIGYKEVEPAGGFGNMEPKAYKAMLDRYGLRVPSTHNALRVAPELEKQLEGYQLMGIQYTMINGGAAAPAATPRPAGAAGGSGRGAGGGRGPGAQMTEEAVKRSAAQQNENGKLAKKFGIKALIHNHTGEFTKLEGSNLTQYDVLLRETDPEYVCMELDIGWASVAGQDIVGMIKAHPGRFEMWHVKDARGIKAMTADMTQTARQNAARLWPVGLGEVDYKSIFALAQLSGMKHFYIEQDNAGQWGDSVAAAKASLLGLTRILS